MAGRLWNSSELVAAFNLYRRGEEDEEVALLEASVVPRHIDELVAGTRALMRRRGATEKYIFSDEAVNAVAQDRPAYIRGFAPKHRLMLASVAAVSEVELRFERTYDTRPSLQDELAAYELKHIWQGDMDEHGLDSADNLEVNIELVTGYPYDYEKRVNLLSSHSPQNDLGETVKLYPGYTEASEATLLVVDYMTLGRLIEFDRS